ncbi:SiaB family protein kinase [Candidatus Magnetaquicoccus inordinatus]|uniref:SiaB family protein kinase n=1 Tax=Candidatus Magnetaquicoccus inordinatus TaxID=2496818 RepID=UPI00102B9CE1|nr:SiaB family protein kinase [Candidatus Magnetaquicoccus inordinatus]
MLAKQVLHFRELLFQEGILFCYSGYMTEEILSSIGNTLKQKMALDKTDKNIARGVFTLFVEQVQNVIRYSSEVEPIERGDGQADVELRYGLLTIGQKEGRHFVSCANMIARQDVERLRGNLTKIQSMDREQLKAFYKEVLRGATPEGSKGAGVGFVDIARQATHGFQFDFHDVNEEYAYFCLKAFI